MQTIDTGALLAVRWKNGGGTTRTVAVWPEGAGFEDFVWRVSIADVRQSGGFSAFPGVDRTILLLEGQGLILHGSNGAAHALTEPFRPHSMPGDEPVDAELVNGAVRDFNVMVRRGRARAAVEVWRAGDPVRQAWHPGHGPGDALFYCARGVFAVGPAELPAGWACFVAGGPPDLRVAPKAQDAVLIGVLLEFIGN